MTLNEGRRALAIKEMFVSGDWLLPHLNGELYITKPPLLYWLSVAFSYLVGQVNEWTLRLPSALAALSVIAMTFRYAQKHFGQWPALFSAQLLVANVGFAMMARRVEIEMLLTALCVGSLLAALQYIQDQGNKGWIYFSYLLLALAFLTKGPVVLLFVTLPLLVAAIWLKEPRTKQVLLSGVGWLIFSIVGLSWYLAVTLKLGPDIWVTVTKRDMLEKMQADSAKPLLSYIGWIAVDFLLLIGILLVKPKNFHHRYKTQLAFVIPLIAFLAPLLIFSIFSNKHAKYLLPVYPFIALLIALQVDHYFGNASKFGRRLVLIFGIVLPLVFAIYYAFVELRVFDYRVKVFPEFQAWSKSLSQSEIYAYGDIDSRLVYYSERPIRELDLGQLQNMMKVNPSFLLLTEDQYVAQLASSATCEIKAFKPYLKKKKSLIVLGYGNFCRKPH